MWTAALRKGGELMMSGKAVVALGLLTCLGSSGLEAQEFPTRPITLIVPYTAGGGNDAMARVVADSMGVTLGQQIVIENRGGAGGSIATRQVARAAPDGYTWVSAAPARSPSIRRFIPMSATTRARISPPSA
jgi:tripartite-type tricarboxylate transporter receptor subunit TctC